MTEREIEARLDEIDDELDELEFARELEYRILEGFWEIEETPDGEFHIFPIADEEELEIPV